jgi:hypothetical protein
MPLSVLRQTLPMYSSLSHGRDGYFFLLESMGWSKSLQRWDVEIRSAYFSGSKSLQIATKHYMFRVSLGCDREKYT